jgi:hypothetical protein
MKTRPGQADRRTKDELLRGTEAVRDSDGGVARGRRDWGWVPTCWRMLSWYKILSFRASRTHLWMLTGRVRAWYTRGERKIRCVVPAKPSLAVRPAAAASNTDVSPFVSAADLDSSCPERISRAAHLTDPLQPGQVTGYRLVVENRASNP